MSTTLLHPARVWGTASTLFLALIWLLPFSLPDHKVPIGTFWQEWVAVALLAGAIITSLARSADAMVGGIPKVAVALFGLSAIIAVQFGSGLLNFSSNLIIPLLYLSVAASACVLGNTLRQSGELETLGVWIALACVIGGIFNVNVQLAQLLGIEHYFPFMSALLPNQHPFGNINQSNHLAAYLGLALASVLYLRSCGRLSLISTGLVILILTTGLALSGQRSALMYTAMPLMLTLLSWRTLPQNRTAVLRMSLAVPVLFVLINLLVPHFVPDTAVPMEALQTKSFYDNRANLWEHAWAMFFAHPLLGVGFDQYWPQFFEQLDVLRGDEAANNPHNLIAALLAETGIIGTIVVLVPLALWLWRTRLSAASWAQWLGLTQIVIIGFHSLIEYPLWYSYFLIIIAFWLGACDPAAWTFNLQRPQRIAVIVLLVSVPVLSDLAANYQTFRARVWSVPHAGIMALAEFKPTQPQALADLSGHWFFRREVLFWQPDLTDVSTDQIALKIALNEQAMKIAPSSGILFRQVLLRVLNGQADEAVRLLHRARQIYPERYQSMQLALPLAAKKWPDQFGPVLPALLDSGVPSHDASASPRSR